MLHVRRYVGLMVYGSPGVVVLQTNVAPEHPNRAVMRAKDFSPPETAFVE